MGVRGRLGAVAAACVASSVLVACSGGSTSEGGPTPSSSPSSSAPSAPAPSSYVAFGDSFTAGPGISPLQPDTGFCQRSTRNWPALVAERLDVDEITDLSCSGATSADVLSSVAQAPLDPDTRLVTVGAGGNDGALFTSLITACAADGPACGEFVNEQARPILEKTVTGVVDVLEAVRDRAPRAQVLLVGYLRIMPSTGTCDTLGVPASQTERVRSAERALEVALETAADDAGVDFVSLVRASRGHDACAGGAAWTNGARVTGDDGIVFHPRAAGMQAVARAVAAAVDG